MKNGGKAKRQPRRFKIKALMIEIMDWKGIRMAGNLCLTLDLLPGAAQPPGCPMLEVA